jgi:major vault protein
MVLGPRNYVPPVEVEVAERRKAIPMDTIEGIYVREYTNGTIRAESGKTYMLQANEELYKKEMPDVVTELLIKTGMPKRQLHNVVTFKVPYNTAVQIYDYKSKQSRVAFGPDLVMLNPDEQFTVNYLSGGTPKKPGKLVTVALNLGPSFSTDLIEKVETSDHARLELRLSYNWKFKVDDKEKDGHALFNVRDCIGDLCSSMASKVRATVATLTFDQFHKSSARSIRRAIFGLTPDGQHVFFL